MELQRKHTVYTERAKNKGKNYPRRVFRPIQRFLLFVEQCARVVQESLGTFIMYLYPYPGAGVQPVPSLSGHYRGIPVSNQ